MHLLHCHYSRLFCSLPFLLCISSPICTRCDVPLHCLTTVVKAVTLDIPGLWRNTELSRARLYFFSTPLHSNSDMLNNIIKTLKTHILTGKYPLSDNKAFTSYTCGTCHTYTHLDIEWRLLDTDWITLTHSLPPTLDNIQESISPNLVIISLANFAGPPVPDRPLLYTL